MSAPRLVLLASLLTVVGCPAPPPPRYPVRSCDTAVVYAPAQSLPDGAMIKGEWNAFVPERMERMGDSYVFRRALEPRDYGYLIEVGGQEQLHADNPFLRWVGGREYSRLRADDCRTPLLRLSELQAGSDGAVKVVFRYEDGSEAAGLSTPLPSVVIDGLPVDPIESSAGVYALERSLPNGRHALRINATDGEGRAAEELYLPFWIEPERFRFESGAMYFAFTDRFRNGSPANDRPVAGLDPMVNYKGGDFAGITQALEEGYFDSLGVRTIWLSPLEQNPDEGQPGKYGKLYAGYHGYWPSKPRVVQSRFGTMSELRALTDAAHRRGIRVIADLVFNHVHDSHPYFQGRKDEGWFHTSGFCVCGASNCDWEARRLDCWFTPYLPDFDWKNNAVADQLQEDALYWIKEAELDGFRVDAVKHFEHSATRTIAGALNAITKDTGTEFYLVGETFTGSDGRPLVSEYIGRHELDGQFDFPLHWPIVDAFAKAGPLTALDQAVKLSLGGYPPGAQNSPFLGNHDVERFISTAAGQIEADPGAQAWGNKPPESVTTDEPFRRLRDAMTFVLTQPGVPLIYYGDEIGLPGAGDPDNRRMMRFGGSLQPREADLLAFVRAVGAARPKILGLQSGALETLAVEADLYVYQRDHDAEPAIVAFNRATTDRTLALPLEGKLATSAPRLFKDVGSARTVSLGSGATTVILPAQSASVFVPADAL